ncbi:MAG: hypothetical protein ABIZ07_08975, partial [Dermatophilaceae bacterium]
ALVAATAAGALLLAISSSAVVTLPYLLTWVAAPAAVVLVLLLVGGRALLWRRLAVGIMTGFWIGLVSTIGLEIVRETGFRGFHSMPGDLPMLIGIKVLGRMVMQGPDLSSNLAGWGFHFWNGAMFGIIFVLLIGGFPRSGGVVGSWAAAGMGALYGVVLGTGFLLSPLSVVTGAGIFGANSGPPYVVTVYLAHLVFGAILGLLTHHFARTMAPLWTPVIDILKPATRPTPEPQPPADVRTKA